MEGRLNASPSGSEVQEDKSDGSIVHQEGKRGGTSGQFCEESTSKASSPSLKSSSTRKEEDELQSAKVEMSEVREENERLKIMLKQIEKDYKSLQMRFVDTTQHETQKKNSNNNSKPSITDHGDEDEVEEEPEQLVSLCLGRSPGEPKRDHHDNTTKQLQRKDQDEQLKESLKLGLDCNPEGCWSKSEDTSDQISPGNSSVAEITKEEQAGETWPPSKALKTMRSSGDDQDELSQQQPSVKRARVSVRARCDTPTMNDGCQWRKYGQKIAKGNPCPRAYYRCTVAPSCPVRKQVQRCAEDMSILITTYEGTHNHPLPISATAMASTTSAAASMLLSGSSTSLPSATATASSILMNNLPGGLNFNLSDNPSRSSTRPFYLPSTCSTSLQAPFPTITLDLTSSSGPSTQFNMLSSSSSRFPPTSLGFSSSEISNNSLPAVWGNGYLNYTSLPYNKTSKATSGSVNLGRPSHDQYFHHQPHNINNQASNSQQVLTEILTKAIASDPNFRSVIAAAISSTVGNNNGGRESLVGQTNTLKWDDHETINNQTFNSNPAIQNNGKGCGSSYLSRSNSSLNPQSGSLMFLQQQQPPLPFSLSKNTSMPAAADSNRDEIN